MEKQGNLQLELFSGSKDFNDMDMRTPYSSFLNYIRNYEKIILIIIGMIITSIISFTLGVERGKQLRPSTFRPIVKQIDSENKVKDTVTLKERNQGVTTKREETKIESIPLERQGYAIQLATYKIKTYAQKEVESLKKKGLSPLVLSKGSYTVLCVGNFSNRETAQSLLTELKKRYKDCYIRRL